MLGAGGTVGLAYHAGVLQALAEDGFDPVDADLIIGTSAGSVIGAYLRSGWTPEDFWQLALGTHPNLAPLGLVDPGADAPAYLTPAFHDPVGLLRRAIGSAYVLGRSALRVPVPVVPKALRTAFPAGFFVMTEGRRRLDAELPAAWPDRLLWLCAVDIVSGRRIVLGSRGAPSLSLASAVLASCAIPGVYPPVKLGRRVLVDGGIHSTSNLDLAVRAGCERIVAVVPMAYDPQHRPGCVGQLARRAPTDALQREVALARRRGIEVLVFTPTPEEVRLHGLHLMRNSGLDQVARAAYAATDRRLKAGEGFRPRPCSSGRRTAG